MCIVRPISDVQQEDISPQTIDDEQPATATTPDPSTKTFVHRGVFCFGDNCAHKWGQPIVGVRYDCVSCKKLKRKHHFCATCYHSYPFKGKEPESFADDNVQTESADNHFEERQDDTAAAAIEHVFQCISTPRVETFVQERLYDKRSIDFKYKSGPIGEILKSATEFSQLSCAVRCILLYPFGLLNYLLHRLFTKQVAGKNQGHRDPETTTRGPLRWYLSRTQKSARSFGELPWVGIGICGLLNAAAIAGIVGDQYVSGVSPTLYWVYVYELFFAQSLTAQVQMVTIDTKKRSVLAFVIYTMTGISLIEQCLTVSVDVSEVYSLITYGRDSAQPVTAELDPYRFVFPAPATNTKEAKDRVAVDPAKVSLINPTGYSKLLLMAVVVSAFAVLITVVSILSMDTSLMISVFGQQIKLPEMITYDVAYTTSVVSGCVDAPKPMARVLLELQLSPVPSTANGLPLLFLQFVNRNVSMNKFLEASVETFWYADLTVPSQDSINLQLLDGKDFIPLIVSFPNTSCTSVPNITLKPLQAYPDSLQGLEMLRLESIVDYQFFLFYFLIGIPSVVICSCIRALVVCLVISSTWELWHIFDSFTDPDEVTGGVWSPDHMARQQIDFSAIENCHAWYELRKHLCEITSINLRTAIPMLRIAVVQFVLALAAVSWYAVSGNAPIPGFAYLLYLCVNPLVVLTFLVPLTLIWIIQNSHIGLMAQKFRQVEMLPPTSDHNKKQERKLAARALLAIKTELEASDERVAVLGFELSPAFIQTLATLAATAASFLLGSSIQYYTTNS